MRLPDNLTSTTSIVASENRQQMPTPLQPDTELYGEFKSLNEVHTTQQSTPDFDIQAFHVHSIHGYLDEPRSTSASLIAIRFTLSNESISMLTRRLRYSIPTLTFRQYPHGKASTNPRWEIRELRRSIYITESYSKETNTMTWEVSAGACAPTPAQVSMNGKFGAETSKESTRKHSYRVINGGHESPTAGGERPVRDVVYWNSRKNEEEKLGVGNQLHTAVLIHRHDAEARPIQTFCDASRSFGGDTTDCQILSACLATNEGSCKNQHS